VIKVEHFTHPDVISAINYVETKNMSKLELTPEEMDFLNPATNLKLGKFKPIGQTFSFTQVPMWAIKIKDNRVDMTYQPIVLAYTREHANSQPVCIDPSMNGRLPIPPLGATMTFFGKQTTKAFWDSNMTIPEMEVSNTPVWFRYNVQVPYVNDANQVVSRTITFSKRFKSGYSSVRHHIDNQQNKYIFFGLALVSEDWVQQPDCPIRLESRDQTSVISDIYVDVEKWNAVPPPVEQPKINPQDALPLHVRKMFKYKPNEPPGTPTSQASQDSASAAAASPRTDTVTTSVAAKVTVTPSGAAPAWVQPGAKSTHDKSANKKHGKP